MKYFILFVFVGSAYVSFGQCNPFFDYKQGNHWVYETYDSTDNLLRKIEGDIVSLESKGSNGWISTVVFTFKSTADDEPHRGEVVITCDNGIVQTPFSRFLTGAIYRDSDFFDTNVTTTKIEWPANLAIGDKLSDASLSLDAKTMKLDLTMFGRKVASLDTVNLSLGQFVVFKVEYDIKLLGLKEEKLKGVDYIAEKFGVIRTEIYEKNGVLREYSEITKFTGY